MTRRESWFDIGLQAWSLWLEASAVIGLRTLKIAAGGAAAEAEVCRMVSEKLEAGLALQMRSFRGGLGPTAQDAASGIMSHYRERIRANRRRLAGS